MKHTLTSRCDKVFCETRMPIGLAASVRFLHTAGVTSSKLVLPTNKTHVIQ